MKSCWLHRSGRPNLILFCNGWGMDQYPFQPLGSMSQDVLMLYDYTDIPSEPQDIIRSMDGYHSITLVAWSMGVAYAQKLFANCSSLFTKTIAVNGTLCPINDHCGIPVKVFAATRDDFSERARLKFYRRMCRDKLLLKVFLGNQPRRSVQSQQAELAAIYLDSVCETEEISIYSNVVISQNDYIMPTLNQLNFWKNSPTHLLSGAHFPFYLWESWDDLLQFIET